MIEAVILNCAFGVPPPACTEGAADDVISVKVQPMIRAMAKQSIVAEEAEARAKGRMLKVVCGGKA